MPSQLKWIITEVCRLQLEMLDPQSVHIHVEDAVARGIRDGDMVRVYNDRGSCVLPAKVTEYIARGVVSMAQGAWHTPDERGEDHRGSINNLTSLEPSPLAKGNAQHTNLVEIEIYCCKKEDTYENWWN